MADFRLSLALPEALHRFAENHFGPGLEEQFLSSQGGHDEVIYSVLRVRDPDLLHELWIRLEENESTFPELAMTYGEGPEARKNGLMGPCPENVYPPQLSVFSAVCVPVKSIRHVS